MSPHCDHEEASREYAYDVRPGMPLLLNTKLANTLVVDSGGAVTTPGAAGMDTFAMGSNHVSEVVGNVRVDWETVHAS